jgi:hypothetical protein
MKMDAMQKRRMWKVIGYHFFFTVYILFLVLQVRRPMSGFLNPSNPTSWIYFAGEPLLRLLQPISLKIAERGYEFWALALTPLWSICFGWIYVKFIGWLNHFPVLGKIFF